MPLSFMSDSVTVVRPGARTVRGSTVPDWAAATEHVVDRVQVTAAATQQDRDGRVVNVHESATLRAPYDADVRPGDRVRWGGEIYEVDGEVFHSKSPTGRVSSTRCALRRWEG
ncbi:MAG: hypothetical protein IKE55_03235 [Kiritimatiellae bacterium]|nr:hypothetical protein [Kiritimatiellia bacterium]